MTNSPDMNIFNNQRLHPFFLLKCLHVYQADGHPDDIVDFVLQPFSSELRQKKTCLLGRPPQTQTGLYLHRWLEA